jgi:hypothetical protein
MGVGQQTHFVSELGVDGVALLEGFESGQAVFRVPHFRPHAKACGYERGACCDEVI